MHSPLSSSRAACLKWRYGKVPFGESMNRRIVLSALSLPICLLLCGCLVMRQNEEKTTGNYVAKSTIAQIQPGKTTAGWVKSILGEPSAVDKIGPNSEIWKY